MIQLGFCDGSPSLAVIDKQKSCLFLLCNPDDGDVASHQESSIVMRRYGSKHSYGSNDSGGSGSSGPSKVLSLVSKNVDDLFISLITISSAHLLVPYIGGGGAR